MTPGLEERLRDEVREVLGAAAGRIERDRGGVEVGVSREGMFRLALRLRLAESMRLRLGRFRASDPDSLAAGLRRLPWDAYLRRGASLEVRATSRRSKLQSSSRLAESVLRARPPSGDAAGPPFRVHLRLDRDEATVSLDAGGELLHKRGWKTDVGPAPLRETIAAAAIRVAAPAPAQPLWDPFAGSGTIVLERLEPLPSRAFAFERWRGHDPELYAAVRASLPPPPERVAIGSDADPAQVSRARENARRAGVPAVFEPGDFETVAPSVPEGAAVVTNLPWGRRTAGGAALHRLYERWGDLLARRPDLDPVVVLTSDLGFERASALPWDLALELRLGGTPVRLLRLRRR